MKDENTTVNLIVLVAYTIQPTKTDDALSGFTELINQVKQEPHFVNIKRHVDINDQYKILLYEEWRSSDYYNSSHFKTPQLQNFMKDSRAFLAGPPHISQWKIEKEFKAN
ncbi:MAG: putative quinol monooxygenase [Gelidibacter sp.]